ncbi:MAG TPA: hypothetical protein VMB52_05725 [Verrucomicrobiae bacterium]|nr:hypothetical protein [Verrucomicrobiae bacterium]
MNERPPDKPFAEPSPTSELDDAVLLTEVGVEDDEDNLPSERPDPPEVDEDRAALLSAAVEEARSFTLQEGWQENRPVLNGVYMDGPEARVHEDMLCMITYAEDGTPTVTIAVSDLGVIAGMPATLKLLQHFKGVVPELAQGPLNICEGRDTPVIARSFTLNSREHRIIASEPFHAIARPTRLDVDEADRIMGYDPNSPLHNLRDFADEVIRLRQSDRRLVYNQPGFGYTQDDTNTYMPRPVTTSNSADYINEILLGLFNEQMAEWAHAHQVPVIYRNRRFADGPDREEMHRIMLEGTPAEQAALMARYSHTIALEKIELGATPMGNVQRDVGAEINMSSSMRESDGTVNSANISAALAGDEPPFPTAVLPNVIENIEALNIRKQGDKDARRLTRMGLIDLVPIPERGGERPQAASGSQLPEGLASDIVEKLQKDELDITDVSWYILRLPPHISQEGQPGWARLADGLMTYIVTHPGAAVTIIHYFRQRVKAFSEIKTGQQSRPPFDANITLKMGRGTNIDITVNGAPNRQTAQRLASRLALEALAGRHEPRGTYKFEAA